MASLLGRLRSFAPLLVAWLGFSLPVAPQRVEAPPVAASGLVAASIPGDASSLISTLGVGRQPVPHSSNRRRRPAALGRHRRGRAAGPGRHRSRWTADVPEHRQRPLRRALGHTHDSPASLRPGLYSRASDPSTRKWRRSSASARRSPPRFAPPTVRPSARSPSTLSLLPSPTSRSSPADLAHRPPACPSSLSSFRLSPVTPGVPAHRFDGGSGVRQAGGPLGPIRISGRRAGGDSCASCWRTSRAGPVSSVKTP